MIIQIDYPFRFDNRFRTASAGYADHIREMIEQLLMTDPGERVNRPDFGGGLRQMVFAPNSPELAAALQFTVRAAVQEYLSDLIEVQDLAVTSSDSTLTVALQYTIRATHEKKTEQFVRPL